MELLIWVVRNSTGWLPNVGSKMVKIEFEILDLRE